MKPTRLPGVGYIRVSRKMGRSGESYITEDVQRAEILAHAAANGVEITRWYSEVDVSGGTTVRDEFQSVLADVRSGEAAAVVVATLDRFSRDAEDTIRERRLIREAGAQLLAADTPVLPGSIGEELFLNRTISNHLFLTKIKERWAVNRQTALNKGVYFGNRPPTGYEWEREFDGPDGKKSHRLVVVERLREPVRAIFIGRAVGTPWPELADDFAATTGIRLNPQSFKKLVRNRAYRGEIHVKGLEPNLHAHEAIVPTEREWLAAQSRHARSARSSRKGEAQSLLAGVLTCGSCGRPMSFRGGEGRQYTCQRVTGGEKCPAPALIVADRVDSYVLELVAELLNGIVAHGVPETGSRLAKLDQAVADAEEELALYQEHTSIRDGVDAYNRGKAARAAAVEEAKAERERELAGMGGLDEEFVALLKLFDDLPMKHQRKVVRRLFDRITVHRLAPGASTHSPIEERVEIVENPLLTSSGVGDRDRP